LNRIKANRGGKMRAGGLVTRITLGAGAAALSVLAASAADLPARVARPSAIAPVALTSADWSGFYLGGHVGWGQALSRGTYDDFNDTGAIDFKADGFVGGAQAGYNWQFGRLVYGVEVDGTWGSLDTSRRDVEDDTQKMKTDFLGSLRFRSGAAIDNIWIYGTIGVAYAQSKFTVTGDVPNPASRSVDGWGWVSGFGAEYAIAPNWSVRAEYLYYDISKRTGIPSLTGDSFPTDFVKIDGIHVVQIGANYRFGGAQARASGPAANWSGFYVGAHGGYGKSRILGTYDEAGDNGSFDFDPKGAVGGLQAGYNFQNGAWVYGIEVDGSWSGMKGDRIDRERDSEKLKTTSLASVRGRIGVAAGSQLYYVTAGWGMVNSKLDVVEGGTPANTSFKSSGLVVGSGMDWALDPNWSVRLEGLTYLVDKRRNLPSLTGDSEPQDFVRQDLVAVVRVGVNYRFGGPY
jgi:outer membrane immunogenic protein